MLSLRAVPAYEGRRLAEIIAVRGRLRPERSAATLLNTLTSECGVSPFLLAEAEREVLLLGVGQVRSRSPGREVVPSARRPVHRTLLEFLDPAEVLIEPVNALEEIVQHRYAGAVVSPGAPAPT